MIGRLKGVYGGLMRDGSTLIDVGGVGYTVRVSAMTIAALGKEGAPVQLYVHTAVREDAIDLYGFPDEEELAFFKLLTSVSGIGPKTALGILNIANVVSLKRAIAHGDASLLTRVYGMGKKSAERIVVELRDRLAKEGFGEGSSSFNADTEVLEALEALGYRGEEAREALKQAGEGAGVRERLSAALKFLGSPARSA